MIEHVRKVLADVKRVVPDYDEKQGYELAGFVWFQGFNDLVSDWTYDKQMKPGGYDLYGELMADFIRDVRKDLSAPKLPFVIGVLGIGGVQEGKKPPQMYFRQAQAAPASLAEFKGNVTAVETAPFWDDELDALQQRMEKLNAKLDQEAKKDPNLTPAAKDEARKKAVAENFTPEELKRLKGVSNGGYHYLGAAKIMAPIGKAFAEAAFALLNGEKRTTQSNPPVVPAEMAGYLLVPHGKAPETYNAGFSMYVAAWPLLKNYPGQEFQSGLFGTWMSAQYDGPAPKDHYSDIEGGLGWWHDTRFATETPKFIMGGVALNFSEWANGPGAGKGRDWKKPAGQYAVAQLSPWVLWPPDGLNLKQGTCGELFGYGYLPLPLTAAKKTTAGKDVPTGNQCWTLFLNTGNFKGPVAFFTAVLLVASLRREPAIGGSVPRRPAVRAEQGVADGDPAHPRVPRPRTRRETLTPESPPRNSRSSRMGIRCWCIALPRIVRPRCGTASRRGSTAGRRFPARSTPRPPASKPSMGRAERPGTLSSRHTPGQEGAAGLEFVRHSRRTGRRHLRLPVEQGLGDENRFEGWVARYPP